MTLQQLLLGRPHPSLTSDLCPYHHDNRYKLFIKYPQGLRLTFDRIKERLEDSDSSVVSCAVNVICELADKNPKNYLAMAPQFFRLLTTSSNNWMLIKVCLCVCVCVCVLCFCVCDMFCFFCYVQSWRPSFLLIGHMKIRI